MTESHWTSGENDKTLYESVLPPGGTAAGRERIVEEQPLNEREFSHYFKDISNYSVLDVYRVLDLYQVSNHAVAHAIKKLLCSGERGAKNEIVDIEEAIKSLYRAIEIIKEDA